MLFSLRSLSYQGLSAWRPTCLWTPVGRSDRCRHRRSPSSECSPPGQCHRFPQSQSNSVKFWESETLVSLKKERRMSSLLNVSSFNGAIAVHIKQIESFVSSLEKVLTSHAAHRPDENLLRNWNKIFQINNLYFRLLFQGFLIHFVGHQAYWSSLSESSKQTGWNSLAPPSFK